MRISVVRIASLALALSMCFLLVSVHSYPQLFVDSEPDQEEVSDEVSPLTRIRRGSQIASYGHHQPSYHSHGHEGWGHAPVIHSKSHKGHGGGAVGPIFTYVRTDHSGNFQWGVRHKAGGSGWHGR